MNENRKSEPEIQISDEYACVVEHCINEIGEERNDNCDCHAQMQGGQNCKYAEPEYAILQQEIDKGVVNSQSEHCGCLG